jgi:hypothetical protein
MPELFFALVSPVHTIENAWFQTANNSCPGKCINGNRPMISCVDCKLFGLVAPLAVRAGLLSSHQGKLAEPVHSPNNSFDSNLVDLW